MYVPAISPELSTFVIDTVARAEFLSRPVRAWVQPYQHFFTQAEFVVAGALVGAGLVGKTVSYFKDTQVEKYDTMIAMGDRILRHAAGV